MHKIGIFIALSTVSGIVAAVGCGNGGTTTSTGTGGTSSTTTSSATTSAAHASSSVATTSTSTTGAGGTGGAGTGGAPPNPFECTVPATAPSKGSCVAFTPGDGGVELDAGVMDGGVASTTTCNPITNGGCTGTDVCGPDSVNQHYYCQHAGTPAGLAVCADCTAPAATCGVGGLCVGTSMTTYVCAQMCCTDADCGAGKCNTMQLTTALPDGVGLCIP